MLLPKGVIRIVSIILSHALIVSNVAFGLSTPATSTLAVQSPFKLIVAITEDGVISEDPATIQKIEGGFPPHAVPVPFQVGQVGLVHGNDVIGPMQILGLDLSRVTRKSDSVGGGAPYRPIVGALPNMPTAGPGRIDSELIGEPFLIEDVPEHTFGQWRAADVAEANEEDGDLSGHMETSSFQTLSRAGLRSTQE